MLRCPACSHPLRVTDTRTRNNVVRRRRACSSESCSFAGWTVEVPVGRVFEFRVRMGEKGLEVAAKEEQE